MTPAGNAAFDIARRAAIGPAALVACHEFVRVWPEAASAWDGLPGLAALCLVGAAYIAGGVRAGTALGMGPRAAGALGATHLAMGAVTSLAPMLAWGPDVDPVALWLDELFFFYATLAAVAGVPLAALIAFSFVPGGRLRLSLRAAISFLIGVLCAGLVIAITYAITSPLDTGTGTGPFPGPVSAHDAALRYARLAVGVLSALGAFVLGTMGVARAIESD